MLQLRCTKKVIDQFGLKGKIRDLSPPDSLLGNWYTNPIKIERRNTLIFMSERSYLSFILYGVRKDNAKNLAQVFLKGLDQLLTLERFNIRQVNKIFNDYDDVEITKTDSRQVLGNMNDLAQLYNHMIYSDGGLQSCDLWSIIHQVNRTPQRNLDWSYSTDIVKEIVGDSQ